MQNTVNTKAAISAVRCHFTVACMRIQYRKGVTMTKPTAASLLPASMPPGGPETRLEPPVSNVKMPP